MEQQLLRTRYVPERTNHQTESSVNLRVNKPTVLSGAVHKIAVVSFSALALSTFAISAKADLVTNGGFESTTAGPGQMAFNTNATGWTTPVGGYNFIFAAGAADTTGANGQYGNLTLWGPNSGSANGLPASSPNGGNFVAADGDFQTEPISQTINGLTSGDKYTVSFYWAGAQQTGFSGPTTEAWIVGFGAATQETPVLSNASHGFTGWQHQSFTFTADGTSDVLSFLAVGTPQGVPPFSLLDGVSVNSVSAPEPVSVTLLVSLMGLLGGLGIRRFRKKAKS